MSNCAVPTPLSDGWPISTPEAVDLDSRELCAAVDWLDQLSGSNVHSIVVARRGKLVFEHYRKGADWRSGAIVPDAVHGPRVKHGLRSATKSVTGLLVGIALERELVRSLDETVFDYFPEYAD